MKISYIAVALILSHGALQAQVPNSTMPLAVPVNGVVANAVLRTGTEVPLRLLEELTTKNKLLRVGQRIRLETMEPVLVQGSTVIPIGTPATAEITVVRNKGMWGKSGYFAARLLNLSLNGRLIRLGGVFDDKGVAGGVGAVAVSALVFLPVGFFITGTSASLPSGTIVKSFIDEDVPLDIAATAPAPLKAVAVQTPPPLPASTASIAKTVGTMPPSTVAAPAAPK
jgi:hypothetical protein